LTYTLQGSSQCGVSQIWSDHIEEEEEEEEEEDSESEIANIEYHFVGNLGR